VCVVLFFNRARRLGKRKQQRSRMKLSSGLESTNRKTGLDTVPKVRTMTNSCCSKEATGSALIYLAKRLK